MFTTLMMLICTLHSTEDMTFSLVDLLHHKINTAYNGGFISQDETNLLHGFINGLEYSRTCELRRNNQHQKVYL